MDESGKRKMDDQMDNFGKRKTPERCVESGKLFNGELIPKLLTEELEAGNCEGKQASLGSKVTINYVAKLLRPGASDVFDSKMDFKFTLGNGEVILGLDKGIIGMYAGGKRNLKFPSAMAYGSKGIQNIPTFTSLEYDIEMLHVS